MQIKACFTRNLFRNCRRGTHRVVHEPNQKLSQVLRWLTVNDLRMLQSVPRHFGIKRVVGMLGHVDPAGPDDRLHLAQVGTTEGVFRGMAFAKPPAHDAMHMRPMAMHG
jgi:hypothetical protein